MINKKIERIKNYTKKEKDLIIFFFTNELNNDNLCYMHLQLSGKSKVKIVIKENGNGLKYYSKKRIIKKFNISTIESKDKKRGIEEVINILSIIEKNIRNTKKIVDICIEKDRISINKL